MILIVGLFLDKVFFSKNYKTKQGDTKKLQFTYFEVFLTVMLK